MAAKCEGKHVAEKITARLWQAGKGGLLRRGGYAPPPDGAVGSHLCGPAHDWARRTVIRSSLAAWPSMCSGARRQCPWASHPTPTVTRFALACACTSSAIDETRSRNGGILLVNIYYYSKRRDKKHLIGRIFRIGHLLTLMNLKERLLYFLRVRVFK